MSHELTAYLSIFNLFKVNELWPYYQKHVDQLWISPWTKLLRHFCCLWDSYLCLQLALLHSVSYFFFRRRSPSSSLCTVFYSIFSNIDEVLLINPSSNVFELGDFNVRDKDQLTYSNVTNRSGELCYNFSISNDLTEIVNFSTPIPDCDSPVLVFWIYLFFLMLELVPQWLSLHWEILVMLSQFPLTFHHIHNRVPCFIALLTHILMLIGTVFAIIWEIFCGRISLNLVLLQLLVNFVSSDWNWGIYSSSKVSGQPLLIFMVFSCLCYCHNS